MERIGLSLEAQRNLAIEQNLKLREENNNLKEKVNLFAGSFIICSFVLMLSLAYILVSTSGF
jgi:hypothetical protein